MKICNEQQQKERLTYGELMVGDVFRWVDFTYERNSVLLKTLGGRVYLSASEVPPNQHFLDAADTDTVAAEPVTRYPNACLILGDPE